ncbi:MAG: hypothetical protein IJW32_01810 [Clostridia bacterium]|nr:hypothetical protein [Clostridia bacterium]
MNIKLQKDKIIIEKDLTFDVAQTLECGQIFSFKKLENNKYVVVSDDKLATIICDDNKTIIKTNNVYYFYNFFDFKTDYYQIKNDILSQHPETEKFLKFGDGIRILKQSPYQTIISFIVSANNNIKRIKNILFKISSLFGERFEGTEFYTFPTLKQLSKATVDDFNKIGAGYRSEYLFKTIALLQTEEYKIENLNKLPTLELKQKLLKLMGVGPKVADCILLFGFSRTDVFPVDTWIRKSYYLFENKRTSDENISKYFVNKFKDLSGYAQQYIYNYMLNSNLN